MNNIKILRKMFLTFLTLLKIKLYELARRGELLLYGLLIVFLAMEDNDDKYVEQTIQIHGEVFDKDFDDAGWEPVEIDESDEEAAHEFGY